MTSAIWADPPVHHPPLQRGEVHVWRVSLDRTDRLLGDLGELVSPDERARAARQHRERDAHRLIATRAVLRLLLGRYLAIEPADVPLRVGAHGKPALAMEYDATQLEFNVSHAEDVALLAFAAGRNVGVDVEYKSTAAEAVDLREWTRMEAFAKASGVGLSRGDVMHVTADNHQPAGWTIHDLPAITGSAAALVYSGGPARVRCWRWSS